MKRAIISDIHSNLEALEAVLDDIEDQNAQEVYCLGDLVGYGPNPVECIDRMMALKAEKKICLLGNHDQATLFDPDGFNSIAEQAIYWTRERMEQARGVYRQMRWDFMGELPRYHHDGNCMYVHGSPRNPLNEYVFSDDIIEETKMEKLFSIVPGYCFQGHTHVPGVFTENRRYYRFQDLSDGLFKLADEKLMINVGSVGQPRDRDPRACYVIFDTDAKTIQYRRIEYNVDKTCKKIFEIPELDNFLGERIKQGK
ncbi:MAG: metallophosphoesterase family protein [Planctomycetia bacterium]|nr:metallophosphoesterase family protein [Planctomycetia bacterium]